MMRLFLFITLAFSVISCTERKFKVVIDNQTGKNIKVTGSWEKTTFLKTTFIGLAESKTIEIVDNKSDKDIVLNVEIDGIKNNVGCYYQRGEDQIKFKLTIVSNKVDVDCIE